jgi:hypothetical protein
MLKSILRLPAAASQLGSFLKHPILRPIAQARGDSEAVQAVANRIKLTGWFDPPSGDAKMPAAHTLSYRRLAPWDQATIKLTIATFLAESQISLDAGVLSVAIFGTCGREMEPRAAWTNDSITGFELRGRQFAFTKPLHFTQGCGVEGK